MFRLVYPFYKTEFQVDVIEELLKKIIPEIDKYNLVEISTISHVVCLHYPNSYSSFYPMLIEKFKKQERFDYLNLNSLHSIIKALFKKNTLDKMEKIDEKEFSPNLSLLFIELQKKLITDNFSSTTTEIVKILNNVNGPLKDWLLKDLLEKIYERIENFLEYNENNENF